MRAKISTSISNNYSRIHGFVLSADDWIIMLETLPETESHLNCWFLQCASMYHDKVYISTTIQPTMKSHC